MDTIQKSRGGFSFNNCKRNEMLENSGNVKAPKMMKTGTTIVGLVYKNGVVLGADTRATEGSIVCDKNCEKIHFISKNIWCCGAGTSADTENTTGLIAAQLEMIRLGSGQEPRVVTAMTRLKQKLFRYQGHVSAALVLGGVDSTGSHLYSVYPHGSTDKLPYATMGSGSLAAMAVFEAGYKDNLSMQEAIDLVDQAVQSGIWNDLGSGGNVDICTIDRNDGPKMLRNYKTPNDRLYRRKAGYNFTRGSTEWIQESEKIYKTQVIVKDVDEKKSEKS